MSSSDSKRMRAALQDTVRWTKAMAAKRVLVAGDLMLDEYLSGEVRRISPEAPVPVVEVTHRAHVPGGAANVAANIAGLGGAPILLGLVGDDENGELLCQMLTRLGVNTEQVLRDPERPTTCKTRIVSGQQQIVRLDREVRKPIPESIAPRLLSASLGLLPGVDACVISDYAKGLLTSSICSSLIRQSGEAGKPTVVDPKDVDFRKYAGCSVLTPNLREAEAAAGGARTEPPELGKLAGQLRTILGERTALLITRGAEGMSLFVDQKQYDVPALSHEVFDVTGAGDTVAGTLALALAAGASYETAMLLSNLAASIVVQKSGTATATVKELLAAAEANDSSTSGDRSYASLPNRKQLS